MKLIDAIKNKGKPFFVPHCSRDSLPEFFRELGYRTGAEIGVWEGEYTEKFCKEGFKMYGIDPWFARAKQNQYQQNARYGRALVKLSPARCDLIRKTSAEAVKDFKDDSLDFVYIDGMHKYSYVVQDIMEWIKKVRKGGCISGHDYLCHDKKMNNVPIKYQLHIQVKHAVDKCIEELGIENFYIFGRSKPIEKETQNDKMLSWLFFKP